MTVLGGGGVGAFFSAMNGEAVKGRNVSNDCEIYFSEAMFLLHFTPFYFICRLLFLLC